MPTATITSSKTNLELDAEFSNTKVRTLGEAQILSEFTNKLGNERDQGLIVYRQALNTDPSSSTFGARHWVHYIYTKTRVVPKGGSADQGAADPNEYNVIPTKTTKALWGQALTETDDGATEHVFQRLISEYPTMLEGYQFTATGSVLATNWTPVSTAKTVVFQDGTALTVSAVDTSGKTITLDSNAGTSTPVIALYETSDSIG
jgi:hypothetical protein